MPDSFEIGSGGGDRPAAPPHPTQGIEQRPIYLASPVVAPEDGIDLFRLALVLLRGWKVVAACMILVGVASLIYVAWRPKQYLAQAVLSAGASPGLVAVELTSPCWLQPPGTVGFAVMRTYTNLFREAAKNADGKARITVDQSGKQVSDTRLVAEIRIWARAETAEGARLALTKCAAAGVAAIDDWRSKQRDIIGQGFQQKTDQALQRVLALQADMRKTASPYGKASQAGDMLAASQQELRLSSARAAYRAAESAAHKWDNDFELYLPAIQPFEDSDVLVDEASSPLSTLLAAQLAAVLLGATVVLAKDGYRSRLSRRPLTAGAGGYPRVCGERSRDRAA